MFEDQPRIGGKESVCHGSAQQVDKLVCHLVGGIGEDDPVRTVPSVGSMEKVLNLVSVYRHVIRDSTLLNISAQQFQRGVVGFHVRDMGCAPTQGFDADGPCSCIEIKEMAIQQPITNDREQCFAHPIGRGTDR